MYTSDMFYGSVLVSVLNVKTVQLVLGWPVLSCSSPSNSASQGQGQGHTEVITSGTELSNKVNLFCRRFSWEML